MPLDTFQSFSSYWATNGAVLCRASWATLYPFLCQRSVVDWSAKALRETYELMPCLQWLSCYHDVDASTASLNLVDEGACEREVDSECGVELIKVYDRSLLLRSAYQKFVIFRYVMHQLMVYFTEVCGVLMDNQREFLMSNDFYCPCMENFVAESTKQDPCVRHIVAWRHLKQNKTAGVNGVAKEEVTTPDSNANEDTGKTHLESCSDVNNHNDSQAIFCENQIIEEQSGYSTEAEALTDGCSQQSLTQDTLTDGIKFMQIGQEEQRQETSDNNGNSCDRKPHIQVDSLTKETRRPSKAQRNALKVANSMGSILSRLRDQGEASKPIRDAEDYIPLNLQQYSLNDLVVRCDTNKVVRYDSAKFSSKAYRITESVRRAGFDCAKSFFISSNNLTCDDVGCMEPLPRSLVEDLKPKYTCCLSREDDCLLQEYDRIFRRFVGLCENLGNEILMSSETEHYETESSETAQTASHERNKDIIMPYSDFEHCRNVTWLQQEELDKITYMNQPFLDGDLSVIPLISQLGIRLGYHKITLDNKSFPHQFLHPKMMHFFLKLQEAFYTLRCMDFDFVAALQDGKYSQ
ncbi:uncharacterized protein LOC108676652 [Hyalella azteca]|uniref:Uncharacterized protein LOC108676652 n=1 Tax=Hyalella azteca TaxID=294128 RepID=A0A8B7P2L1_HYAAZ|nr:uncharacterized protein LOC108676652 [Hyalella azteca]